MIDNNSKNEVVINFFGEVDDFTTAEFQDILARTSGEDLEILVNSPGGDVFEGITIANLLMGRDGRTTLTGVGLVASIASVILMAGDKVQMARDAMLMIHDAWGFEMGNAREMRKTAKLLDKISNQIAVVYADQIAKNGKLIDGDIEKTREAMRTMMRAERWLTAQEAFDLGLIDAVINGREEEQEEERQEVTFIQANQKSDLTLKAGIYNRLKTFKNTPTNILNKFQMQETKKESLNNQSFLQKLAAFFGFKAELTAIEEPKELTELEKAQELLAANGFVVTEAEAEQASEEPAIEAKQVEPIVEPDLTEVADLEPQEDQEELAPDPVAELTAQVQSLSAKLKDLQFANASKSTAQANTTDNKKTNKMSKKHLATFNALAELIKS